MKEQVFETKLIEYITSGNISSKDKSEPMIISDHMTNYVVKTKLWKYESDIKTTEDLWNNFKEILERHNRKTLNGNPLTPIEFNQVKQVINNLKTPYEAGQFLYGLNGVSQIEVDLEDKRHVFLTVFDQSQVGAGDTVYQVVNQIQRPAKIAGRPNRRFDTTLLINGLPIIQIEEKKDTVDVNDALNQMHQYIVEHQYSDIFSTVQILVAMTPNNIKYMANTTEDKFNKDFAFNWQREKDNSIVRDWREFSDLMLSIPMAHQMATNYMILDGTQNKQMLKVMRPYQVYATRRVIDRIKSADFDFDQKLGYIWHTTGSGKTITSFKTAWLASRLPNVDKVVFVVDRIALTKQTSENYKAYDPDATDDINGTVEDTKNTRELRKKLNSKDRSIIVTSVQKLTTLVKKKSFKSPNKNIVFIVDEAHRSTGGESFALIQKKFKNSAWVGYTGTPMFDETTNGLRTKDIFGELLHAYTIREAIADQNVLGFKVDFETTISKDEMKKKYLPHFYKERHPKWSDKKIQNKIDNLTPEDMDDAVEPSFYDENIDHVKEVVKDIFKNWRNRSNDGKYNALLTTHVGGGKASTPMAMMYYDEFQRVNDERRSQGKTTLKVAITFHKNTNNDDSMVDSNEGLLRAMKQYNEEFGTNFGLDDDSGYTEDVVSRLNKTASDKNYLDLVIVVDQLLTGFDAPELNTLYVDRTLKGASLIQAYSRTNRIANRQEKPWGRIVNYRWPAQNEKLMNKALAIYANKDSANLSDEERKIRNKKDNITAPEFKDLKNEVKEVVTKLSNLTNEFEELPKSEKEKDEMFNLIREYNIGMAQLKQYTSENNEEGFDYDNPNALIEELGMTPEQEVKLTTVLKNELKEYISEKRDVPLIQIDLQMTHIKDIQVNYDYLTELLEDLMNQVHEDKQEEAKETHKKIVEFANGLDDRKFADKIKSTAQAIVRGEFPPADFKYPAKVKNATRIIEAAYNQGVARILLDFRIKWGITDIISGDALKELIENHKFGTNDLESTPLVRNLLKEATKDDQYKILAHSDEIQSLSKMKYRKQLRVALLDLADEIKKP